MSSRPAVPLATSIALFALAGCGASTDASDGASVDRSDSVASTDVSPDRNILAPGADAASESSADGASPDAGTAETSTDVSTSGDSAADATTDARAADSTIADADATADVAADATADTRALADAAIEAAVIVCPSGMQDNDHDSVCRPSCAAGDCNLHGTCSDATGTAVCSCTGNYTGPACAACATGTQDNNHDGTCTAACTASTCAHGTCSDATGTAACACTGNYSGALCDTCPSGTQDNDHNGTCTTACTATTCTYGTCSDATGAPVCACTGNYSGTLCDTCPTGTQDNDHDGTCTAQCVAGQCGTHGTCVDSGGTATCSCGVPYAGPACATSCVTRYTYSTCTPDGSARCDTAGAGFSAYSLDCTRTPSEPFCTNGLIANFQLGYDFGSSVTLTEVRFLSDWWSKRPATWQVWVGQSATDLPGAGAVQVFSGAGAANPYQCVTGRACTSEVPDSCCPDGRDHPQDTRNVGTLYPRWDDATFTPTSGRYWYLVVPSTRQPQYLVFQDLQFWGANCSL